MIKIVDERHTGKTSRLLLLAMENHGVFVCLSKSMAIERAKNYGLDAFNKVTFMNYSEYLYACTNMDSKEASIIFNRPVYIDDVELFLQHINTNTEGISLSR